VRYKNLRVNEDQYNHIVTALAYYYNNVVCQPSEEAIDYREAKKEIYQLMEQMDIIQYEGRGRMYKLIGKEWKLIEE
jgi:hypothetical protein